jgi:hypothetical protein
LYIQTCEDLNRKPQKTYKGSFNLRIDPQLHKNMPILPLYAFPSRSLGTRQKGSVPFILICCLLSSIFEITDKLTLVSAAAQKYL